LFKAQPQEKLVIVVNSTSDQAGRPGRVRRAGRPHDQTKQTSNNAGK